MKETLVDLKNRRSCRKYKPEQIKDEELDQILEAGMFAPTAMGKQSPTMVVVQDQETITKLSKMNACSAARRACRSPAASSPAALPRSTRQTDRTPVP